MREHRMRLRASNDLELSQTSFDLSARRWYGLLHNTLITSAIKGTMKIKRNVCFESEFVSVIVCQCV